jgi:eukaryotic-like serine/threonine-protein kinase
VPNLPVDRDIQVKISKEGFESYREVVRFEKGGDTKTISPKLDTGSVTVELEVVPTPSIWVDSKPWKGDPKKITGLSADDEHKIVVSATGYIARTFSITGKQGEKKVIKHGLVRMSPDQIAKQAAEDKLRDKKKDPEPPTAAPAPPVGGTGTIRVNAKGGYCNVTIKGAGYGPTPVTATVPAGTVTVTCKPESGPSQSQSVKVEPGGTARASFVVGG